MIESSQPMKKQRQRGRNRVRENRKRMNHSMERRYQKHHSAKNLYGICLGSRQEAGSSVMRDEFLSRKKKG